MRNSLILLVKELGVDRAIAYSSGARVVQAFVSVGSIFFFSAFLTGIEQGFYFTFIFHINRRSPLTLFYFYNIL